MFGIDRGKADDVIAGEALASPFVHYKRPALLHPEDTPVAFTTALMRNYHPYPTGERNPAMTRFPIA